MRSRIALRAGRSKLTGTVLFLALVGCTASVPAPDTRAALAAALDADAPIELRAEGIAIDAMPATTERLTLVDAVRLSLERDPRLRASLARVQVALADAQQARLLPNPILTFVARLPLSGGPVEIEAGINEDLAAVLQRPGRIDAADHRLRSSVARAVATALSSLAELRTKYAAVQALDELLPLLRQRSELLDRLVELAQARLEFGEASAVDVTTLRAQRSELGLDIDELARRRRLARIALAHSIGEPSSAAEWQLDPWAALPTNSSPESAWIDAALAHRPEIQAAVLELAALGDEAAIAALGLWDGSALGIALRDEDESALGPALAIGIPVFDMGDARKARAAAEILAARVELVALSRDVIESVRRALADFDGVSRSLAQVRDELLPLQRQRREEIEAIFLAGHADLTALLIAEQDLQATHSKLVELEERAATALAQLELAAGGPATTRALIEGRAVPSQAPMPPPDSPR